MIFCSFWRGRARYFAILAVLLAILDVSCAILCLFCARYYKGHLRYYFFAILLWYFFPVFVSQHMFCNYQMCFRYQKWYKHSSQYQMIWLLINILYQKEWFFRYTEVSNVSQYFFMVSSDSSQYQIIILVSIKRTFAFDTFDTIFFWYSFCLILIP